MTTLLMTAFEPYDRWKANASWLALVELTRDLPEVPKITTRRYPVDYASVRERLYEDLQANYDFAIHLGQSPGATCLQLESIGLNIRGRGGAESEQFTPLSVDGPVAYRSSLPLENWQKSLQSAGVPAQVSFHAGTFLCNAALYWTHYFVEQMNLKTRAMFLHVPLDVSQVTDDPRRPASLPVSTTVRGIRLLLQALLQLKESETPA